METIIIGGMQLPENLDKKKSYQHFGITQTEAALQYILTNRENIDLIISRTYHRSPENYGKIGRLITAIKKNNIFTPIALFTDSTSVPGENIKKDFGLQEGKDRFYRGNVGRNLYQLLTNNVEKTC